MDEIAYLVRKLRSHSVLTEDLDAAADKIERLREGLLEALEWNWLDDDPPASGEELRALAEGRSHSAGEKPDA